MESDIQAVNEEENLLLEAIHKESENRIEESTQLLLKILNVPAPTKPSDPADPANDIFPDLLSRHQVIQENAILLLCELYCRLRTPDSIASLLSLTLPILGTLTPSKCGRIVRNIFEAAEAAGMSPDMQARMCEASTEWARTHRRLFLRQRLDLRRATLLIDAKDFHRALRLIRQLQSEASRADDRILATEVHILAARAWHTLGNRSRAMSAAVAARTAAAGVFLPPQLAAELEHMAAVVNASEDDFVTAASYWFEAFQAFDGLAHATPHDAVTHTTPITTPPPQDPSAPPTLEPTGTTPPLLTQGRIVVPRIRFFQSQRESGTSLQRAARRVFRIRALASLVYQLLCHLLGGTPQEVPKLLATGTAKPYAACVAVRSMQALVDAYALRDLHTLHAVLSTHRLFQFLQVPQLAPTADSSFGSHTSCHAPPPPPDPAGSASQSEISELQDLIEVLVRDGVLSQHVGRLQEVLLQRHVLRLLGPYERVPVSHLARLVGLPPAVLEQRLSVLILDRTLDAVIQQAPSGELHLIRTIPPPPGPVQYALLRPPTVSALGLGLPGGAGSVPLGLQLESRSVAPPESGDGDGDEEVQTQGPDVMRPGAFFDAALHALQQLSEAIDSLAERHDKGMSRFPLGIRSLVHARQRYVTNLLLFSFSSPYLHFSTGTSVETE